MMFPLIMSWSGRNIPMVQELGFARGTWAPLHAWIAALLFAGAYIVYTFRVLPFVREQQREISLFKLIGVAAAFASETDERRSRREQVPLTGDLVESGGTHPHRERGCPTAQSGLCVHSGNASRGHRRHHAARLS
ncbi:MAG: hypothetical protein KKH51_16425, partial [Actinobacteria bacterium]|nr:hypothetical protein [Actinomycetota bacterium]